MAAMPNRKLLQLPSLQRVAQTLLRAELSYDSGSDANANAPAEGLRCLQSL